MKTRADPESDLIARRDEAARRAPTILRAFFQNSQRDFLENLCHNNGISLEELRIIAQAIVADWVHDGYLHNDRDGLMDLREALRHLRYTVPKKKAAMDAERHRTDRNGARSALMSDAAADLRRAMTMAPAADEYKPF